MRERGAAVCTVCALVASAPHSPLVVSHEAGTDTLPPADRSSNLPHPAGPRRLPWSTAERRRASFSFSAARQKPWGDEKWGDQKPPISSHNSLQQTTPHTQCTSCMG